MNALNALFATIVVILVMSYGMGLIMGGPGKANKFITWELKQLTKFGRLVLKHLFQTVADIFSWLAKQCAPTKKKTP